MGEIRANDAAFSGPHERESKIASSAAEIEAQSTGPVEDTLHAPGSARAPQAIELQRQQVVEQIVPRGDLRKHGADFIRSVGLGNSALGTGSLDRCGGLSHGAFAIAWCLQ
jgi:hypothetical protein